MNHYWQASHSQYYIVKADDHVHTRRVTTAVPVVGNSPLEMEVVRPPIREPPYLRKFIRDRVL
jgi:hypothetical protein